MRKKSGFTIVEQAIVLVPEFEKVVRKLEQQVTLRGQSQSTLKNYIRRIALFVIHFEKLPEQIDPEEINEYLVSLARDPKSPSRSSFKHMVYGLRYYYRLLGMNKNAIALPSLKKDTKLPVILNHSELKELFAAPALLKQRVAITNHRILNIAGAKVTFIAKDYREQAVKKPVTLDGVEFLRRFTLHILPTRFVKIRRYGIYNHTTKRHLELQFVPEEKPDVDTLIKREEPPETNLQRFIRLTGVNPSQCPECKTGRMVTIRELPRIRAPDCVFLPGQFPVLT